MRNANRQDQYADEAEFYDYTVPYRDRQDLGFYAEMANKAGGPVLELGCGTGRVLLPLARQGIEITGLDASPSMLQVCTEKLADEPVDLQERVTLLEGDMTRFDVGDSFHLVTIPFRSFQHLLETQQQLDCLANVHRALAPGGKFILDLFNPWLERLVDKRFREESKPEPEFRMPDGRKVVRTDRTVECDLHTQVVTVELIHSTAHPDGRTERSAQTLSLRYFFRYEVEHLLARSGFVVEALYADYDKSPYGSVYPGELIFVAKKA